MRLLKKERSAKTNRTVREKNNKNKMLVLRKRQVAAVSLILLIGIAGYLNMAIRSGEADPNISVMYNEASKRLGEAKMVNATETENKDTEEGVKNNTESVSSEYFKNAKAEREKKRSESLETLSEIVNASGSDKSAKASAQAQIEQLVKFTECELAAENMIRAKGYGDCVVFMGENVTSVAVSTNGLNEIDAAVITELVTDGGEVQAEQVKIVEIKPN